MEGVPRIFAIVPVHNRVEQTLRCLASLHAGSVVPRAVVVDDGSTDGTAEKVRSAFPLTVVLPGDGHLWWGGATNRGVEYALAQGADYVLTLNNDGVVRPDAVARLLDTTRAIPGSMVGARRNDLACPDTTWSDGWHFSTVGSLLALPAAAKPDAPTRIDAMGCNLLLIPAACFAAVGLFDAASLPQCYCDWDFQLRAARLGWTVYCEPRAVVLVDRTGPVAGRSYAARARHAAFLLTSTRSARQPVYLSRFLARHFSLKKRLMVTGRTYLHLVATVLAPERVSRGAA